MNRDLFPNLVLSWLAGLHQSYWRRPQRQTKGRPSRQVQLTLERLEAREVPTSVAAPAPTFTQAAISLYEDGFRMGYNPFFLSPIANATNGGNALQADIAANTPSAQPFASLFVLAGEMAGHAALGNVGNAITSNPFNQAVTAASINSM